jgi:hypothetical protein
MQGVVAAEHGCSRRDAGGSGRTGDPARLDRRTCRHRLVVAACVFSGLFGAATAFAEEPSAEEPSLEACQTLVAAVRAELASTPVGAMTRRFVDTDLAQALTEAGNGEYDDCMEYAQRARVELHTHGQAATDDLLQR